MPVTCGRKAWANPRVTRRESSLVVGPALFAYCLGTITMPTGPPPPAGNGAPGTDANIPCVGSTTKAEMVLSTLLTTYRNLPLGSSATPKGCCAVGTGDATGDRVPLLRLKAETLLFPTSVT